MYEWQNEFELKSELLQADFEKFEQQLFDMPRVLLLQRGKSSLSSGAMLRAAIAGGWIIAPECEVLKDRKDQRKYFYAGKNVEDMHPAAVDWLGAQIDTIYNEIKSQVPKNL